MWEIENLVGYRVYRGNREFLIRWKHFSSADDTWEPFDKISTHHLLLDKFYRTQLAMTDKIVVPTHLGNNMHGMRNDDNVCYMNSILQCLSSHAPLASFFVKDMHEGKDDEKRIVPRFGMMIKSKWSEHDFSISAGFALKKSMRRHHPQFDNTDHQDAHEFCMALLDDLHEGLKQPPFPIMGDVEPKDVRGRAMTAWQKYQAENNSIIFDLFYGQLCTMTECGMCGLESVKFEVFDTLVVPIPAGATHLLQCFDSLFAPVRVPEWECPNCKMHRGTTRTFISRMPRTLVVSLKRFEMKGGVAHKIDTEIDFPLFDLDLRKWSLPSSAPKTSSYSLFAVCNHLGNVSRGHYTAFVKKPFSEDWFLCNDKTVCGVDTIVEKNAYVLFYSEQQFFTIVDK